MTSRIPLSNKSGWWFEVGKYTYLLLAFILYPIIRKRTIDNLYPITSWDEYHEKRKRVTSREDYSVPLYIFQTFSERHYTMSALCAWEEDHHVWWFATYNEETILRVKYLNRTWRIEICVLYYHARNRIYEILRIGQHYD